MKLLVDDDGHKIPRRGFAAWNRRKTARPHFFTSRGIPYHCMRCGYEWKAMTERKPALCARCGSRRYDTALPPDYSSLFMGLLAEHVMTCLFDGVVRMPRSNIGYDYTWNGIKIEVKSSALCNNKTGTRWRFNIGKNKIANRFVLCAFDNRTNLNPVHIWDLPGDMINDLDGVGINNSIKSLRKWSSYEITGGRFDAVRVECDKMREVGWTGDWALIRNRVYV